MTNFQAIPDSNRLRWLTPERAVLVLPFAAGLAASVALTSFVLAPLFLSLQEKRQQADDLRVLRDELPFLKAQLENAEESLSFQSWRRHCRERPLTRLRLNRRFQN